MEYQLTLLLTERCNLRCAYCYCDKQMGSSMTYATAIQAIDEALQMHSEAALRVLLMGGEPFMEFDTMRQIVEYVRRNHGHRDVFLKTVTNGTLVHGEVQQWLLANRDLLHVSLSLDGSRATHNRNRCNSYDQIDIPFFLRAYGNNAEASMVACPENMDSLASEVIALQEQGFRVKCVLADDCKWDAHRDPLRWAAQLLQLTDYYLAHPMQMPFSQLMEALHIVGNGAVAEKCHPNINTHSIDPHGHRYGCHRCTPYYNNGTWYLNPAALDDPSPLREGCSACVARAICCACPALAASLRDRKELSEAMCALSRVTHVANAALVARMLTQSPNHIRLRQLDAPTKYSLICGVQSILNSIAI